MMLLPELSILAFSVIFLFLSLGKEEDVALHRGAGVRPGGFRHRAHRGGSRGELFSGAYRVDFFSQVFKVLLAAGFALVVFMFEKENEVANLPEFFMFLGFSTLGLMLW